MARYKGTQASHLYEKSMHTLCTISEHQLLAEASTILDRSLSHTYAHSAIMVSNSQNCRLDYDVSAFDEAM